MKNLIAEDLTQKLEQPTIGTECLHKASNDNEARLVNIHKGTKKLLDSATINQTDYIIIRSACLRVYGWQKLWRAKYQQRPIHCNDNSKGQIIKFKKAANRDNINKDALHDVKGSTKSKTASRENTVKT